MHFMGTNPHDWSIFFVHVHYFEDIFSVRDDVVVVFVPPCCGCEFWAGNLGDWREVEVVYGF